MPPPSCTASHHSMSVAWRLSVPSASTKTPPPCALASLLSSVTDRIVAVASVATTAPPPLPASQCTIVALSSTLESSGPVARNAAPPPRSATHSLRSASSVAPSAGVNDDDMVSTRQPPLAAVDEATDRPSCVTWLSSRCTPPPSPPAALQSATETRVRLTACARWAAMPPPITSDESIVAAAAAPAMRTSVIAVVTSAPPSSNRTPSTSKPPPRGAPPPSTDTPDTDSHAKHATPPPLTSAVQSVTVSPAGDAPTSSGSGGAGVAEKDAPSCTATPPPVDAVDASIVTPVALAAVPGATARPPPKSSALHPAMLTSSRATTAPSASSEFAEAHTPPPFVAAELDVRDSAARRQPAHTAAPPPSPVASLSLASLSPASPSLSPTTSLPRRSRTPPPTTAALRRITVVVSDRDASLMTKTPPPPPVSAPPPPPAVLSATTTPVSDAPAPVPEAHTPPPPSATFHDRPTSVSDAPSPSM
mmetsp:Transcript_2076/g.6738  ORF Transcript_2076/g.6738 Transcript_2076/m.6738 type:complete len:477 (-) Transcript_2076:97-1527(-)